MILVVKCANHWIWQGFENVLTRPITFPSHRDFRVFKINEKCERTWYVCSIEHYKLNSIIGFTCKLVFFLTCASLSNICRISSRVFIQAPNFEIVGCLNLLILFSIHNGCLYIIEPKRRTFT